MNRKRGQPAARIVQKDASENRFAGKHVLGQPDVEFEIAQNQSRDDAGHDHGREHRSDDNVEQIVAGVQGGDADQQCGNRIDDPRACNFVIDGVSQTSGYDSTS